MKLRFLIFVILLSVNANFSFAQTTEFTYQGRLLDNSQPPPASYDFEFRLFSTDTGGTAIGMVQRLGVAVNSGIFTVKLDFGANFDGTARWLEIAARPASGGTFTTLVPRQPISSAPYAIRSLNSTTADNSLQLGGTAANQFVQTNDSRLSDARNPLPNSPNYIQNTTSPQSSSNFNISGVGTANIFNAAAQFNIGGNRVLSVAGSANIFAGVFAGTNNTGNSNSFFGTQAGQSNTSGNSNSFFGERAGAGNTTGFANSFFGSGAGASNTTGSLNAFFGFEAGMSSTVEGGNSFFGAHAGRLNAALFNSFFGYNAGTLNTGGEKNSFFGYTAGQSNTANNNSFFGALAGTSNTTGAANAFFGESAGEDNTTGKRNTFIGRWSGNSNTSGDDNTFVGFNSGLLNTTGSQNVFIGIFAGSFDNGNNLTIIGSNAGVPNGLTLQYATAIGADAEVSTSNTIQLGRANGFDTVFAPGLIRVGGLGTAGSTNLCRNASNIIATCSSSLRYKANVETFTGGLNIVRRLRPITFNWIDGGNIDVGFGAEDVNQIEPILTTRSDKGEIEGVKYGQISVVLVNAIKEQQSQIEQLQQQNKLLQEQLKQQQQQTDALKRHVCQQTLQAEVCKEKEQQK